MSSKEIKNTANWITFGFIIPILAELLGAIIIVSTEAGAYAEGFSYIVVIVMLVIAIPLTLFGNIILVPKHIDNKQSYIFKGMILPGIFILAILIYYTGIWDKFIDPLFPSNVEKIQTAGGGRVGDNSLEDFFVVNEYTNSVEDMTKIENYARKHFATMSRECTKCLKMNIHFYFVPKEHYDPINYSLSRKRAVAVFRHLSTDDSSTIVKIED